MAGEGGGEASIIQREMAEMAEMAVEEEEAVVGAHEEMETASDREGGEELNAAGGFGIEVMIVAEGGEVDGGVVEGGWGGGYQMLRSLLRRKRPWRQPTATR